MKENYRHFSAVIDIIGINPFVFVPNEILKYIFKKAGKDKGPITVKGTINKKHFTQTLVKYSGHWRLYINTTMLKNSPKKVGERINVSLAYDDVKREVAMHPQLQKALEQNLKAKTVFEALPPSRKKEIVRYIANLKTEESIVRNVTRAISFLEGKGSFVGRGSSRD